MKSLRFSLHNYQLAGVLYLQELVLFVMLFVPLYAWLWTETGSNYFGYRFSMDFLSEIALKNRALGALVLLSVLLIALFLLVRIFLMGGIFESLLNQYSGMRRFLYDCGHHFKRFFFLFLCYSMPLLMVTAIVSGGLGSVATHSPNQMMPVYTMTASRIVAVVLSILFSYWHTAARYRTIIEDRFHLAFRMKGRLFLRFFGYQFLSVIVLSATMLGGLLLLPDTGIVPWLGVGLIQLGLIVRNVLKVASYKVLS